MKAIKFRTSALGFDAERVNTIRLGKRFANSREVGETVELVVKKGLGALSPPLVAEITGLHVGTKDEILPVHAQFNHSIIALGVTENHADVSNKRLRSVYGPHIYDGNDFLSVIYFRLVDGESLDKERGPQER